MNEKSKSKIQMFYGATPENFTRARELRKNETVAEKKLWTELKKKKIRGFRFRRQHPIKHFIVDFYCHKANLVIEVDGSIHNLEYYREYDILKERELKQLGIKVLRFTNKQILFEIDHVLKEIMGNLPPSARGYSRKLKRNDDLK
jgi:very-short-patch-repair endonuclease